MNEPQFKNCQKQDGHENLLGIDTMAERLNISPHTVRGLVLKRKLSFIKIGARVLFRPLDLEDFIQANLIQSLTGHEDKS